MFDLTNRVALITGAGRGMGVGVAHTLAAQGAAVVVNDLDPAAAEKVTAAIVEAGGRAIAAPFDITDLAAVRAGVEQANAALGGHVDILVNNAGVPVGMSMGKFRTLDPEVWRIPIELNLYGSMNCVNAVVEPMVSSGWGRIIQISSGAARTGLDIGVSLYASGKSGIEGFVRHLAVELGPHGITANSLALGLMDNAANAPDLGKYVPTQRLGTADDVAAAVTYLASAEASWMTGQTIDLNGGAVTS